MHPISLAEHREHDLYRDYSRNVKDKKGLIISDYNHGSIKLSMVELFSMWPNKEEPLERFSSEYKDEKFAKYGSRLVVFTSIDKGEKEGWLKPGPQLPPALKCLQVDSYVTTNLLIQIYSHPYLSTQYTTLGGSANSLRQMLSQVHLLESSTVQNMLQQLYYNIDYIADSGSHYSSLSAKVSKINIEKDFNSIISEIISIINELEKRFRRAYELDLIKYDDWQIISDKLQKLGLLTEMLYKIRGKHIDILDALSIINKIETSVEEIAEETKKRVPLVALLLAPVFIHFERIINPVMKALVSRLYNAKVTEDSLAKE
ncbi:hypothetical protein [Pyrodictium abyssi]|uniref:hypothetical protein n=1 Tax=Pyrodictium abyssi TaxID=54256 RepID=UPI0030C6C9A8